MSKFKYCEVLTKTLLLVSAFLRLIQELYQL